MQRFAIWWEGGASFMVALLFWIIVVLLILSVAAHNSLDLFIKAFTALATAGVGIAVWQTTRAFQRATITNAEKKLRLDLLDKRLPVWNEFKKIRNGINERSDVTYQDVESIRDIHREAEMLFGMGKLSITIKGYLEQANIAAGRPRRISEGITAIPLNMLERQKAFKRMNELGNEVAELLKGAIHIGDL